MVIGIDIDDTLIGTHADGLNDFYNEKFGTSWKREDYRSHKLEEVWGGTRDAAVKIVQDFIHSDDHDKSPAVPYAKEAVEILAKKNKLVLVTARNETSKEKTLKILDLQFPKSFESVHFTSQYFDGPPQDKKKKSEICKGLGVEIFIDDALHNADEIAGAGIPVLLLDAPWNQTETLPPLVTRVYSWKEIVERLA